MMIIISYFSTLVILVHLPSVRLQCRRFIVGSVHYTVKSYLDNPFPPGENAKVRCSDQQNDPLVGWTWSLNGRESNAMMLNTLLAKYTELEDGTTLRLNGVNTTDEGLYRCVYQSESFENSLYIHVYARAVFAACPRCPYGCANTESILSAEGESITFDASIIYAGGGYCGFKQKVQYVRLKRCVNLDCNNSLGLASVNVGYEITTFNSRISVSPNVTRSMAYEPRPDYDDYDVKIRNHISYVFTLSTATLEDSGLYLVTVTVILHPATFATTDIKRKYFVTVRNSSQTITPTSTLVYCEVNSSESSPAKASQTVTPASMEVYYEVNSTPAKASHDQIISPTSTVVYYDEVNFTESTPGPAKDSSSKKVTILVTSICTALAVAIILAVVITLMLLRRRFMLSSIVKVGTVPHVHNTVTDTETTQTEREGPKPFVLSSKPAIRDLMTRVAMKAPDKWLEIGLELGLAAAQIRAIASQHCGESAKIFMDIYDH